MPRIATHSKRRTPLSKDRRDASKLPISGRYDDPEQTNGQSIDRMPEVNRDPLYEPNFNKHKGKADKEEICRAKPSEARRHLKQGRQRRDDDRRLTTSAERER